MAAGIIEALKCSLYGFIGLLGPRKGAGQLSRFDKSFSANALTSTTIEQISYNFVPTGYFAVFAGFSTDSSTLLMARFTVNQTESQTILGTRNVSSALSDRDCHFYYSIIQNDLIQDERNL